MQVEETTTSTTNTTLKPTRASFIRGLPLDMPVDEVIERGREAGIMVQPSDVHAARYYMRQASVSQAASKPPTIAQQLMLGGTISTRESTRDDETVGLTKIAGVRNGTSRAAVAAAKPVANAGKRHKERAARAAAPAEISIDAVLKHAGVPQASQSNKTRAARRVPGIQGSLEQQLHNLVVRLGTQRAKEIIDQIEELAFEAS